MVNIGETMTFLSGSLLKSTMHRVARSPLPEERFRERFSLVYFCHANEDTELAVLEGLKAAEGEKIIRKDPPISCVTGRQVRTVKDWIEHRHSMGRLAAA